MLRDPPHLELPSKYKKKHPKKKTPQCPANFLNIGELRHPSGSASSCASYRLDSERRTRFLPSDPDTSVILCQGPLAVAWDFGGWCTRTPNEVLERSQGHRGHMLTFVNANNIFS